jgi:predicted dinucleotide-binding enzyme
MTTISIIGTGNMGTGIAGIFADGGATVESIKHSEEPASFGDIVVLAVPYTALPEIAEKYRSQLAGKIVVDITNPVDFATFTPVSFEAGSGAADLAAKLPESTVVKAFNTNFAPTLATKTAGGSTTTTVLVAGDDADAKATLSAALTAGGVNVLDAGPLARARELEAVGFLQMGLAVSEQISWTDALGVIK